MPRKIVALFLAMVFPLQSAAMANPVMAVPAAEGAFCPVLARGISRGPEGIHFSLDNGDVKTRPGEELDRLSGYFKIGLALPNDAFWVNLRPDGGARMIDPDLERTDMGQVLLAADVQLKKDLARLTSPATETGRKYWEKLYAKAETLAGQDAASIPTLSRPWIVPGEVVMVQAKDNSGVHIYKALLKVMLEQDYLQGSPTYNFRNGRSKELNDYAAGLIREIIIPRLNKEINSARRYAALRQVYYSLILAQWYKRSGGARADTRDLSGMVSRSPWSKETYFREYQQSFRNGEYDISEARDGRVRRYVSGGFVMGDVIPGTPAKTIAEITSQERVLLDGGFRGTPKMQVSREDDGQVFMEPWREAQATKLFNEAIETDNRIHELFLSDKAYPVKARELSGLLTLMETQLLRLDVLTAADIREVSGLHARLYAHFTRSADASDGERRAIYDRYISNLVPIDNFSDDLVPWISTRRINWSEVPSLHTLWNILHQCLLMDAPSIGIGTQTTKRIDGWDRDFVIVGQHDEYVDRLLGLFEGINKGEYSSIIIVNEGRGRFAVNIRELPEGHAGVVHVSFPDNTVEWRLWMYSERQAVIEETRFRNAGFTLVSSRGNYVLGSESADYLREVLSVVVDKDESSALKDGGQAVNMLEQAGIAQCLREAVTEQGLVSRMSADGRRLELRAAKDEPAGFFYWKLMGTRSVSLKLHVPYGLVDKKSLLKDVVKRLWAKGLEAKILPGAVGSQGLLVVWPERAAARDGGEIRRIIEETGISEAVQSAAGKAGYFAILDPRLPSVNLYALNGRRPEGGFVCKMVGRKVRLSLVWTHEGRSSQKMLTLALAALEQKGLIVSRVPGIPVIVVSLARETELTPDVRVLLEYLSDPASDPASERFEDRVSDLSYLTEYGEEFDEVLFSLLWKDFEKYYRGLDRVLTAIPRVKRYPGSMFHLQEAIQGAAGDIVVSRFPQITRARALTLVMRTGGLFSQQVLFRKNIDPRLLTDGGGAAKKDGGVGGIDLRSLPVAGVTADALLRSLSGGRETRIADLDAEFGRLTRLFGMDAAPSGQRIKEFVLACWRGGEWGRRSGEARECLARLFRAQEARSEPADGDTRLLLAVVSGS